MKVGENPQVLDICIIDNLIQSVPLAYGCIKIATVFSPQAFSANCVTVGYAYNIAPKIGVRNKCNTTCKYILWLTVQTMLIPGVCPSTYLDTGNVCMANQCY